EQEETQTGFSVSSVASCSNSFFRQNCTTWLAKSDSVVTDLIRFDLRQSPSKSCRGVSHNFWRNLDFRRHKDRFQCVLRQKRGSAKGLAEPPLGGTFHNSYTLFPGRG